VASESQANTQRVARTEPEGPNTIWFVMGGLVFMLGLAGWAYTTYMAKYGSTEITLTPEAKAYARSLQLTDVEMKASESYLKQTVVEINGRITNAGMRSLESVEIFCLFQNTYGQLVLRRRLAIVRKSSGGLRPGESKPFRLPFDDLPESWNQAMPQLVIAGVSFS